MPPISTTIVQGLTRMVGPLPVWGWGAVASGAVLVGRQFIQARSAAPRATGANVGLGNDPSGGYGGGPGGFQPVPLELPASDPPPFQPGFGENLFLSLPWGEGYASLEGSPQYVTDLFSQLIPLAPVPQLVTSTGGSPAPTSPAPSPVTTVAPYLPLSPTNIRRLFADFPGCFHGDPEYWVRGFVGYTGSLIHAQPYGSAEWNDFWNAYFCAGSP